MKVTPLAIPELVLIEPKVFSDQRGSFFESFNHAQFEKAVGQSINFVQDNQSHSIKNVLRGLHYQIQKPQGKLVRVLSGEIFDVAVDIRKSSPTYGQSVGIELSDSNHRQLWIPPGFAHGFLVTSDTAVVLYKVTNYYDPRSERCIVWNDRDLAINWPIGTQPVLSTKDQAGLAFKNSEIFS